VAVAVAKVGGGDSGLGAVVAAALTSSHGITAESMICLPSPV